eukprot:Gb_30705 [translate_table: standard]
MVGVIRTSHNFLRTSLFFLGTGLRSDATIGAVGEFPSFPTGNHPLCKHSRHCLCFISTAFIRTYHLIPPATFLFQQLLHESHDARLCPYFTCLVSTGARSADEVLSHGGVIAQGNVYKSMQGSYLNKDIQPSLEVGNYSWSLWVIHYYKITQDESNEILHSLVINGSQSNNAFLYDP